MRVAEWETEVKIGRITPDVGDLAGLLVVTLCISSIEDLSSTEKIQVDIIDNATDSDDTQIHVKCS